MLKLKKLMKHELQATARMMLPLFAVVLVLAVFSAFATTGMDRWDSDFLNLLGVLVVTGFGIGMSGMFVLVFVLTIERFRKNLLGDEGYVMMTLPVSIHQHVWAKILISCLWFIGSCVVALLSGLIFMGTQVGFVVSWADIGTFWNHLTAYYAINGVAFLIEGFVLFFVLYATGCLQFYASLAVGHSFARRKILYSILTFFGTQFILQLLSPWSMFAMMGGLDYGIWNSFLNIEFTPMTAVHMFFLVGIVISLIQAAIFYVGTVYFMKKRLNLQ